MKVSLEHVKGRRKNLNFKGRGGQSTGLNIEKSNGFLFSFLVASLLHLHRRSPPRLFVQFFFLNSCVFNHMESFGGHVEKRYKDQYLFRYVHKTGPGGFGLFLESIIFGRHPLPTVLKNPDVPEGKTILISIAARGRQKIVVYKLSQDSKVVLFHLYPSLFIIAKSFSLKGGRMCIGRKFYTLYFSLQFIFRRSM